MLLPGALLLLGFAFPAELRVRGPPGPPATLGPPALVSRGSTASVGGPPKTSSEETSSTRWVLSSKSWVGSDVFLTSKYAFLVGLFLIDIPGVTFRLAALLQEGPLEGGPLLCPLLLKNFVWLALRPLRMHQCVLAEKEEAQWFQREVLTVAADALLHPPAPAAADTAAAETPSLFMGHRGLASTPPLPRASLDGTAVPAAARRRPPDKRRQGTARGASQRGRGQRRRESFKPEAAESRAVAAAAAAAVHERQQAFLLHLLGMDPTTCPTSIELSLCSAAAEANDVLIAGPGSPGREEARSAAATAAAEAKARRSASTLTDVQQQRTHRRPLEALLTYKPRRILKLLGKQHEEAQGGTHSAAEAATVATGETAAATATAAAAAAAKGAGASKKHLRPMLPKALTLERLRRLHKEGIRPEGLRSCLSAALESSAAVTASHDSSAAAAAAAAAATARENAAAAAAKKAPETAAAEAQAQRQLGRRLGGRLLSLRVLPGRRRSTVPSLLHQTEQQQRRQQQKQQQQQQEKQKLQLSVPLPTCPVRLQSYPGTPADPSEVTVSVTSRAGSPSLSLLQCSSLSPCNRVAALPKGGRPQGPPVHSLQAPHFKPQQVRGDEAPGLGPAARKTHRGPPAVVGKSTEGTPHKPFGCRTPGGPSHSVSLAQAFLNLQAQDSQDYGDSDTSEAAAATPARAAEAVTPAAGCRTCSSISTIHPLPYTDEARAAFATAAAAPAVAAAAAAATAHSELKTKDGENVDTPNNCCCCSWLLHLGRRQREVSQPQQQHRSQQQHHQQQQNRQQRRSRDIMVQHLQQGVAKGHSSSYPSKQLMESLRKRQQLLLQQQLPLKGVGIGVLLHRLLRLLLCPRGRGFAAIIDDGVCMQRKQQLLLAALAAAPHLAKLLLILRPFLGLLPLLQHLQQPQQDEQQPADGAAAPRSNSVDTRAAGVQQQQQLLLLRSTSSSK
ncbi:hypothetical protein, conserved [Eimeria maxima]|uniref:SAP domain-containing protein n=1 Tax=Eimeria maxima TaxID=5804 RepID=U6MBE5_EIMMA|nr:hypothetical protein, conserved [Eimeria maxima]CDJ60378.1 hypothetical protein, conserved [Eimeria maxima]